MSIIKEASVDYNIKDFGAVGDGVADDTLAIQKCIDTTPEGDEVIFPVGRYKTTDTLRINKTLALLGRGNAYAQFDGFFGDGAYGSPNYTWGPVIESYVTDRPTIEHVPGRYTGLRMEHLTVKGVGDDKRTGAGIKIAFPGGACEVGIDNVQICNFKVGLDLEAAMHSSLNRIRINGCDTGAFFRLATNCNSLTNLSVSGCGDGVVFNGAAKNLVTGGIQACTRCGVVLDNNSEENVLRDIYFESTVADLAIDVRPNCDATVIDTCHFGLPNDGVRIAANWCRVFSGKYKGPLTITGYGTQVIGPWDGLIDKGVQTLLLTGEGISFGDGRAWNTQGIFLNTTMQWVGQDGANLWPQNKRLYFQDHKTRKISALTD
jgi:hypothetical protein